MQAHRRPLQPISGCRRLFAFFMACQSWVMSACKLRCAASYVYAMWVVLHDMRSVLSSQKTINVSCHCDNTGGTAQRHIDLMATPGAQGLYIHAHTARTSLGYCAGLWHSRNFAHCKLCAAGIMYHTYAVSGIGAHKQRASSSALSCAA